MTAPKLSVPWTVGVYVLLAVAAWAWLHWSRPFAGERLWISREVPRDAGIGIGVGGAIVLLTRWAAWGSSRAREMEEEFAQVIGPQRAAAIPVLALASAGAEEYFFRGALQTHVGVWIQALAFGALHVPFNVRMLGWPFFAGAAGLLFGGLTLWTGNLWPAILAHATVNHLNLSAIVFRRGSDS